MVVLVNSQSSSSAVIYSGLIAAFVSGIVSIIGYCITTYFQNKNNKESLNVQRENNQKSLDIQKKNNEASLAVQKEIARLEKDEKLFYLNRLKQADEIREHIAKIVGLITQYNDSFLIIMMLRETVNITRIKTNKDGKELVYSPDDEMSKQLKEANESMIKIGTKLQEQIAITRMLMFDNDNSYELEIENRLNEIQQWIIQHDTIKFESVEYLTQAAKKYFRALTLEIELKTKQ